MCLPSLLRTATTFSHYPVRKCLLWCARGISETILLKLDLFKLSQQYREKNTRIVISRPTNYTSSELSGLIHTRILRKLSYSNYKVFGYNNRSLGLGGDLSSTSNNDDLSVS